MPRAGQALSSGAINAKKPPVRKIASETKYVPREIFRVRMQAAASAGSAGQGSERARHCMNPAMASMTVAATNRLSLCSDSHTSCGTADTSDDNAAPAPSVTSKAGNAQHTSVPLLVNSDSSAANLLWFNPSINYFLARVAALICCALSPTVSILVTS